jgi:diacylglycerol O-acyltransferase / wax synthase
MKQLSSLDAQFLALENSRQAGHFAGLAVHDPSTAPDGRLTAASMMELVRQRMHLLPPLRWRLIEVPLALDYPYWVDDDRFDLSYHVRGAALPPPGDDHQLAELVSRLHARPLDRDRPLWEMYVISGLASGYVAVYTKIHHAVVDGVSGAEITGLLLDLTPEVRTMPPADPAVPQPRPGSLEMWGRALLGLPRHQVRMLRSVPRALPNLEETTFSALPGAARLGRLAGRIGALARGQQNRVVRAAMAAPKTSFNQKLSPHRRFAFGRMDLQRVKAVKRAYEVTVNDVVVAMCAGAVRRWLLDHKELPDEPLIAQIPVSVRTSDQAGTYGNRILILAAPLHTDIVDPVARLRATAASLAEMKQRHRALPAELLSDVNHFIPPALFSRAARATLALATTAVGRPTWNLVVSNVPGPQVPLYCGGARLVDNYPVSVITDGMGLNITVMSYDGHLDVGIVADRDQMPDVWTLLDGLELSLSELEDPASGTAGVNPPDDAPR